MKIKGRDYTIHPDFTFENDGRIYFWEHLGRLDIENYSQDWTRRKQDYIAAGVYENLITTDDLGGIDKEILLAIIQDIKHNKLQESTGEKFSKHHYKLYKD
jgi:hypothetical protein